MYLIDYIFILRYDNFIIKKLKNYFMIQHNKKKFLKHISFSMFLFSLLTKTLCPNKFPHNNLCQLSFHDLEFYKIKMPSNSTLKERQIRAALLLKNKVPMAEIKNIIGIKEEKKILSKKQNYLLEKYAKKIHKIPEEKPSSIPYTQDQQNYAIFLLNTLPISLETLSIMTGVDMDLLRTMEEKIKSAKSAKKTIAPKEEFLQNISTMIAETPSIDDLMKNFDSLSLEK